MTQRSVWLAAFKQVFLGLNRKGSDFGKAVVLVGSLSLPLILGMAHYQTSVELSGDLPPKAPLVAATGDLAKMTRTVGARTAVYYEFVADDGRKYSTSNFSIFPAAYALTEASRLHKVYMEGFSLQNGKGSFWYTKVVLSDGTEVVHPQEALQALMHYRTAAVKPFICIVACFWAISFFNLYTAKLKISKERESTLK